MPHLNPYQQTKIVNLLFKLAPFSAKISLRKGSQPSLIETLPPFSIHAQPFINRKSFTYSDIGSVIQVSFATPALALNFVASHPDLAAKYFGRFNLPSKDRILVVSAIAKASFFDFVYNLKKFKLDYSTLFFLFAIYSFPVYMAPNSAWITTRRDNASESFTLHLINAADSFFIDDDAEGVEIDPFLAETG